MAEKLKSILRPIHWSLFLKSAILGALWYVAPFWLFVVAALYAYLVPFFRPRSMWWAFLAALTGAFLLEPGPLGTLLVFGSFFLVLGIKDLVIVERRNAYEIFLFGSSFLFLLFAFHGLGTLQGGWSAPVFALLALLFFLLTKSMWTYLPARDHLWGSSRRQTAPLLLLAFFFFEGGTVFLFLPLNFFYQASLLFFSLMLGFLVFMEHIREELTRRRALGYLSLFLAIFIPALASVSWGL